jgi:hypothetical protein
MRLSIDLFANMVEHAVDLAQQPLHIMLDSRAIVLVACGIHFPGPLLHRQCPYGAGH